MNTTVIMHLNQTIIASLKPTSASLGYALFLAVNATGIWGGVFPFLPISIQTSEIMFWFYLAQSTMLLVTFSVAARGAYFAPRAKTGTQVIGASLIYFAGWALLIGVMYLHDWAFPLVVASGVFLGTGSALFYLLWQRLFASQQQEMGQRDLIVGFMCSAVFYFGLYLIPRAVTVYLVPLVFLPLISLALILGNRTIDFSQPMFSDIPRENLRVYRRAVKNMWRSALCMGAIAFCTGIVRSLTINQPEVGLYVNLLSIAALFAAAGAVFFLWQAKGLRLNIIKLYQIVFPVLISTFLILMFAPGFYAHWLASGLFALYSVGLMLTMLQCAQMSRDRGVTPFFVFGLFGGIIYALHDLGFIIGSFSDSFTALGFNAQETAAIVAIYLLALMFFIGSVSFKNARSQFFYGDTIELISASLPVEQMSGQLNNSGAPYSSYQKGKKGFGPSASKPSVPRPSVFEPSMEINSEQTKDGSLRHTALDTTFDTRSDAASSGRSLEERLGKPSESLDKSLGGPFRNPFRNPLRDSLEEGDWKDLLSKRVSALQQVYRLNDREAEVTDLIVHGYTVPRIAETLFVSENTVRTHTKRIYTKLDIHKKQELIELVEQF